MAFVRGWWPPVILGLVGAFLGIGVVEVAGMPAGGTSGPASAPSRPASQPASIAPAAIEDDEARSTPTARRPAPAPSRSPSPSQSPSQPSERTQERPERTVTPTAQPTPRPVASRVPAPTPSPAPSARPTPSPVPRRPADVLNLRGWKLTLPAGREGHPAEIRQPELAALTDGAFFGLTPDRGVRFRAPVGGVTTENSSYPRSELREMTADGRREAAWSSTSGRHVLTMTQAITAAPRAKPHVVAGQIHDAEDDVVMIRLEGNRLFVESDGDEVGLLDAHYRLGTRFTVSISAASAGIRVTYNHGHTVDVPKAGHGWYFKAGCYPQSNPEHGDRPDTYGEVVIYALSVQHAAPAAPGPGRPAPR